MYIAIALISAIVYRVLLKRENDRRDRGERDEIIEGVNDDREDLAKNGRFASVDDAKDSRVKDAGESITTGDFNSFYGDNVGGYVTSGNYNTMVGFDAGKVQTTARAFALPNGAHPCLIATRWIPPDKSTFQLVLSPATASIAFRSSAVRSPSQPSFFSMPMVNSG